MQPVIVDLCVAAERDRARVARKFTIAVLRAASGQLPVAVAARALDENLHALAHARAVRVERERALQVLNALEARLYHACRRARPSPWRCAGRARAARST